MWYFVSLYLQQVLDFSAIEAGLSFLPMTLAIIIASASPVGSSRGLGRAGCSAREWRWSA